MKPLNYKPEKPKQPILEKTKKDKKPRRVSPVLLIFLALIVVGGAMLIGTNYKAIADKIPFLAQKETERPIDKLKSELGVSEEEQTMDTEVDSQEAELIEETTEVDETPVEETKPVVEEKVVKEAPKVVQAGNFTYSKTMPLQIIVGSFGDESNAVRLVEKLNAEGFPAAILGIYGGLHTVSAASFNSMDEIQANSSELQKLGKYWVKK